MEVDDVGVPGCSLALARVAAVVMLAALAARAGLRRWTRVG
jgi:hypothetical protein